MIAPLRRLAWSTWRPIAERAARAYVAGPELAHALQVCRALARQGMATTICPWDAESDNPRQVADWYLAALDGLAGAGLDCYLSIKAPSLGFSRDLLGELLKAAQLRAIGIHFDSLALETAEQTWGLIKAAAAHQARAGCTLPARWRRSLRDADEAVDLGLRVRIVKGQWADAGGEAKLSDLEIRERFLAIVRALAGRARCVVVATHDPALARPYRVCCPSRERPASRCDSMSLTAMPGSLTASRRLGNTRASSGGLCETGCSGGIVRTACSTPGCCPVVSQPARMRRHSP